jgi:hypothetical protein
MGNSPIKYIEPMFEKFAKFKYKKVSTETITVEIKQLIGLMNPKKIKYFITTLEEFRYVKMNQEGFWVINWENLSSKYPNNSKFKEMKLLTDVVEEDLDKYNELIK